MTYKPNVVVAVSSLKGNTIGILELIDPTKIDKAIRLKRQIPEEIEDTLYEADIIMLGTSTYSSKFQQEVEFPAQLRRYKKLLEGLEGKDIILFGSGRSEYPLFCGALDYLEKELSKRNNVLLKYKFEGYPKQVEKGEFKKKVEKLIEDKTTEGFLHEVN